MMKKGCGIHKLTWVLVIVGAINWGLVGLGGFFGSEWNVVDLLLGRWMVVENIVYLLVGISGVMLIFGCKCKACSVSKGDMSMSGNQNNNQGM